MDRYDLEQLIKFGVEHSHLVLDEDIADELKAVLAYQYERWALEVEANEAIGNIGP